MSEGVIGDRLQIMKNYIKDPQVWQRGAHKVFGGEHTRAAAGPDALFVLCDG